MKHEIWTRKSSLKTVRWQNMVHCINDTYCIVTHSSRNCDCKNTSVITVSATDDHFCITSLIFIQLLNNWLLLILLVHRKCKRSKYGFVRTSPTRFLGFPFISWIIRSEILIKVSHRWLQSRFTNYLHLKGFTLFCQISERIHSIINSASPILKNKTNKQKQTINSNFKCSDHVENSSCGQLLTWIISFM